MRSRKSILLFSMVLAFLFSGCFGALQKNTKTDQKAVAASLNPKEVGGKQDLSAFHLDIGDIIQVHVHGEEKLKGLTYQIYPECKIQFPMIQDVKVCGRTPGQVQKEISERLFRDFFRQRPAVTVKVKEFNSKKVHVFGEVTKPGRFDYTKGLTLLQSIAMAGGFTRKAARNDTRLIRTVKGVKRIYSIRLGALGKRKIKDLYLRPGDIIYIPESWI